MQTSGTEARAARSSARSRPRSALELLREPAFCYLASTLALYVGGVIWFMLFKTKRRGKEREDFMVGGMTMLCIWVSLTVVFAMVVPAKLKQLLG